MTEQCQVIYRSGNQDNIEHARAQQLVAACADRQGDNEDDVERALRSARRTAARLDILDEFEFVVPDELERRAVVDWSRRPRDAAQTAATADEIIASPPARPAGRPRQQAPAEQVQHMRTVRITKPLFALPRHGDDAILRLIPFPFKACSGPGTAIDYFPERVRHASIHYSYLDLDSSGEFKLARALLRPGRRGAWIIPLDPCPSTGPFARSRRISFGVWPTSPSRLQGNDMHDEDAKEIAWHDERLSRLWKGLSRLASGNKMGRTTATCHFALTALPAHIRVYVDSHLALAVRDLISKLDKGGLATNRLLYTNEEGAAILTA